MLDSKVIVNQEQRLADKISNKSAFGFVDNEVDEEKKIKKGVFPLDDNLLAIWDKIEGVINRLVFNPRSKVTSRKDRERGGRIDNRALAPFYSIRLLTTKDYNSVVRLKDLAAMIRQARRKSHVPQPIGKTYNREIKERPLKTVEGSILTSNSETSCLSEQFLEKMAKEGQRILAVFKRITKRMKTKEWQIKYKDATNPNLVIRKNKGKPLKPWRPSQPVMRAE